MRMTTTVKSKSDSTWTDMLNINESLQNSLMNLPRSLSRGFTMLYQ